LAEEGLGGGGSSPRAAAAARSAAVSRGGRDGPSSGAADARAGTAEEAGGRTAPLDGVLGRVEDRVQVRDGPAAGGGFELEQGDVPGLQCRGDAGAGGGGGQPFEESREAEVVLAGDGGGVDLSGQDGFEEGVLQGLGNEGPSYSWASTAQPNRLEKSMSQNHESAQGLIDAMRMTDSATDPSAPQWGENAPRGARAVLARILKDGANVPLFLGQTLVNSLRDTGYNTTTSAVCEHVDNAVESRASEIRVYFVEAGRTNKRSVHVAVLDNGRGMEPRVLKVACAFGGSMRFDNRRGIGRYGMGMKAAALNMSPVMDVYSWQELGAFYCMTLDVNEIGQDKSNVLLLPEPQLVDRLSSELAFLLTTPMPYPKNADESQTLLCRDIPELRERLGPHGTIVFMQDCDRLTYRKISTLVDDATREMARIYRRPLDRGLKLYINNGPVEPFDPTYQMSSARHSRIPELAGKEKASRLINRWDIPCQ
jgi:hypothetical protein